MEKQKEVDWKKEALGFGLIVYPINTFLLPLWLCDEIFYKDALIAIPIYALASMGYALCMRWWRRKYQN